MNGSFKLPKRVRVADITVRDGFQALERVVPAEGKLFIINALLAAGFQEMEVTAFAPPKFQPQFRDWEEVLKGLPRTYNAVFSCVATGKKATDRAFEARKQGYRVDRVVVGVIPASERMNRLVVGMSYPETWEWIAGCARSCRELGMKLNVFLTGIFSPPEPEDHGADMMARALEFTDRALELGADDIEHPDHLGEAVPDRVYEYFVQVMRKNPDPDKHVFHIHDARGSGIACYYSAMMAGVTRFETTLGGLGGWPAAYVDDLPVPGLKGTVEVSRRPGLVSTEDFIVMLDAMGIETGIDVDRVLQLGKVVERIAGRKLHSFCPGIDGIPGSGRTPWTAAAGIKTGS